MFSRRLQDVLQTSSRYLADVWPRRTYLCYLEDVLKASCEDIWPNILVSIKTSWRHVEDVFSRGRQKTSSLRWIFAKKIQEMCNKTVDTWPIVLDSVPDWYMW